MSVLLFVVGAIAVMLGVAMVGYGIPINEFSFGNTLIISGTTAVVGGLIVIGIGAAVAQLQRISETLANRPVLRPSRPLDVFDPAQAAPQAAPIGRNPFPPRQQISDAPARESYPHEQRMPSPMPADQPHYYDERAPAPVLRNPDFAPAEEYSEVSLSPRHAELGEFARPAAPPPYNGNGAAMPRRREEAGAEPAWNSQPPPPPPPAPRRAPPPNQFDNMWPTPAASTLANEARSEPKPAMTAPPPPREQLSREQVLDQAPRDQGSREQAPSAQAPREKKPRPQNSAAILKSGVVDGMGYTLYVDGSIEAELPQGTLRFASINDLRNHLAQSL